MDDRREIERDRAALLEAVQREWISAADRYNAEDLLELAAEILQPSSDAVVKAAKGSILLRVASDRYKIDILHSILDSPIDADKLDYLLRDGYHCGVAYPNGIDVDRFLQALTVFTDVASVGQATVPDLDDGIPVANAAPPRPCVGVTAKGLLPVESILIARYEMFRSVYWHHAVRAQTAALQFLVSEYVGGWKFSKGSAGDRLEELIAIFRSLSDEEALDWLADQFAKVPVPEMHTDYGRYDFHMLAKMCNGLRREQRSWLKRVYELRYEQRADTPMKRDVRSADSEPAAGTPEGVYRMLQDWSQDVNRTDATSIEQYISELRGLRKRVADDLSQRLGRDVDFMVGDVLIDIPPAGKDQVDNVFVSREDRLRGIQQMSPISKGVRQTFRFWARHVRVFMSADAVDRCANAGILGDRLLEACLQSLNVANRELFLFSGRKTRTRKTRANATA